MEGNVYSRRRFSVGSAAALGALCFGLRWDVANAGDFKSDPNEIAKWMDAWMARDKEVVGALRVGRFADPIYFLLQPITWKPNPDQAGKYKSVTAPVGFVTDFASIPRIFWSLLKPDGLYAYAAVVHDYLYWTQDQPKEAADDILKFGMEEFGVSDWVVRAVYEAVHHFGKSSWDEDFKLRAAGEKRILQQYPEDPLITWDQWKKQPNVFPP
jgi:hypothetical protein